MMEKIQLEYKERVIRLVEMILVHVAVDASINSVVVNKLAKPYK